MTDPSTFTAAASPSEASSFSGIAPSSDVSLRSTPAVSEEHDIIHPTDDDIRALADHCSGTLRALSE